MVFLLAVMTGLLLVLGVMGWWFLAGINARYSRMLTETAASLGQLHEAGLHSFTGYGNLVELRQTQDPKLRAVLIQKMMEQRLLNDRVFENLERTLTDPQQSKCLQDVLAKRLICRTEADAMIAAAGNSAASVPSAEASLKSLQDWVAYQQACDLLTDRIESSSLQSCRDMAAEIKNLRLLFLVIGALPIVVAIGFLLLTLGLLQVVNISVEEE